MHIEDAQQIPIKEIAPQTAVAVRLRITITPPDGAMLVHTPGKADPVRFDGPTAEHEVPISGDFVYAQPVQGAKAWNIEVAGWKE